MELVQLDITDIQQISSKLPDNFTSYMTEITAKEGRAFKVSSFSRGENVYRCAVNVDSSGWYGKCECGGWPQTNTTEKGKRPCIHVAAAILCWPGFSSEEVHSDVSQSDKGGETGGSEASKEETSTAVAVVESDEENPFITPPADASPLTRSDAVVRRVTQVGSLVAPVATLIETRKAFAAFEDAKISLLKPDDAQRIGGKGFIKKSGWRKIAVYFGLSLQKLSEQEITRGKLRVYEVTYRAITPAGQFQDGTGYCSWGESMSTGRETAAKNKAEKKITSGEWTDAKAKSYVDGEVAKLEHDVRATAETRAKNRAIADLVGGGEVSAEEMSQLGYWSKRTPKRTSTS